MSRRDRQRRRHRHHGWRGRPVILTVLVIVAAIGIGGLGAVGWVVATAASAPSLDTLKPVNMGATSVVFASDGERLGFITDNILRQPVARPDIPVNVRNATVAIEDKRFYEHKGVDFQGIVRAAFKNVTSHGRDIQGGSTLTMQLIKNLYDTDRTRTITRKIKEAKLAEELEQRHPGIDGKRWILDQYLNNVPYGTVGGQTAVGIQAAARIFFDKRARDLRLPEAALLAGLPQAPTDYNPFLHPQQALSRRNEVLRAMAAQNYIAPASLQRALAAPLGVDPNSRYYQQRRESYFFDYVKQQLIDRYGVNEVRKGGLRVYTTINLSLQHLARQAMADRLSAPGDPSAALVSIDPHNGHIVAMASSVPYTQSKFNLAAQGKRQPGSTFKVMVLMSLIRRGVDPKATYYDSKPLNFVDPITKSHIDVQTDDHRYYGRESLFEGLVHSDNTVYQQADLDAGPKEVRQTAYDMGISSHLDAYPAEGLGGLTHGVSPLEMTRAYATLNTGGYRIRPVAVTKVIFPDGHVDTSMGRPHRTKIFTDGQTYEAIQAMEANVQRGTGTAAELGCPVAGKTGTTSSFTDAWFDGFTTGLNTAVWVGYPKSNISMTAVPGYGEMFGGLAPAMIWHDFMQVATKGHCDAFPTPKTPFVSQPFFGHYAKSGAPTCATCDQGTEVGAPTTGTTPGTTQTTPKTHPNGNGGTGTGGGGQKHQGTGGAGFDPGAYESPPQAPPTNPAPAPAPAPAPTQTTPSG
jgi:penicillin-binding protein 1A